MNELTMEQLRIKVSEIVRYKYDKIVQAEDRELMLCHYHGVSELISFARDNEIIDSQTAIYFDAKIEQAHEMYYEKAKKDFESAHKRLF